ncbi:MAG: hypothetical protein WBX25_22560 [Rhodomicrobium sp.]
MECWTGIASKVSQPIVTGLRNGHLAPVRNRIALQKTECPGGRINAAGSSFGKPCGMIRMSVGEHDRRRCYAFDPVKPVPSAIDHDVGAALLHEQYTMTPMPPGTKLNASARPEKRYLHLREGLLYPDRRGSGHVDRYQGETADLVAVYGRSEVPMSFLERPSGTAMKDWNVVITVNDSEGFWKARGEFRRFGEVETTDYHNVLVLRVPQPS